MMAKTHIAVGVASAMLITQPKTKTEFVATVVGGAVGGVMSDIDVKIDCSNKFAKKASLDALYGEIAALVIAVGALLADYFSSCLIIHRITNNLPFYVIGIAALVVLIVLGERSTQRDWTHSLIAMILFSVTACLIDIPIGLAFSVGFASHLIIDLLNKSPERLFFPVKKRICFKVCYADRLGNELLFAVGAGFAVFYTLLFCG